MKIGPILGQHQLAVFNYIIGNTVGYMSPYPKRLLSCKNDKKEVFFHFAMQDLWIFKDSRHNLFLHGHPEECLTSNPGFEERDRFEVQKKNLKLLPWCFCKIPNRTSNLSLSPKSWVSTHIVVSDIMSIS